MRRRSRILGTGCWSFQVRSSDSAVCEWVDATLVDLSSARSVDSVIDIEFDGTQYVLSDAKAEVHRQIGFDLAHALIHYVNQMALDHAVEYLHLHAGAVGRSGRAMVMSGPSGTGKSTLTAQLCDRGWDYLSDEAVRLRAADGLLRGFPKPISLKVGTVALLPYLAERAPSFTPSGDRARRLVPASRLGASLARALEPGVVLVLKRDREQHTDEPSFLPTAPADVVVRLVEQTMDFERYPGNSLLRIAQTAAAAFCGTVEVGHPDKTVDLIEQVFSDHAKDRENLSVVDLTPASTDEKQLIRDGVTSVRIGDSVVVHDATTRRVFSLHDEASEIWSDLLQGSTPKGAGEESMLIEQLRQLEVLSP